MSQALAAQRRYEFRTAANRRLMVGPAAGISRASPELAWNGLIARTFARVVDSIPVLRAPLPTLGAPVHSGTDLTGCCAYCRHLRRIVTETGH
jgi:hypothetical protein